MKLEQNNWINMTTLLCVTENSCLPKNWVFWGIFVSNIDHLLNISESFHYVFLIFCMKLEQTKCAMMPISPTTLMLLKLFDFASKLCIDYGLPFRTYLYKTFEYIEKQEKLTKSFVIPISQISLIFLLYMKDLRA